MRIDRTIVIMVFTSCLLSGCEQVMFQAHTQLPNNIWEVENNIGFDVEVTDTMTGYDFYIDLRNEGTYPYSNIYMFVNTTFPTGKSARDTVECILADHSGRWLGSGLGDVLDNHILFKENIRFPNKGIYRFEFEQGMRTASLPAILDLGISIETHSKR